MVRFRPVVAEVPLPPPLPLLLLLQPARASASAAHVAAPTSTRVDRLLCGFITFLSLGAARMMGAGRGCHSDVDTYRRYVSIRALVRLRRFGSQVVWAARRRMVQ